MLLWLRARERYRDKVAIISGVDLHKISQNEWMDNFDLWPADTHIHIGKYLLLNPSPYSKDDLLNYKSLDSYINFIFGWVREVLVKNTKQLFLLRHLHNIQWLSNLNVELYSNCTG